MLLRQQEVLAAVITFPELRPTVDRQTTGPLGLAVGAGVAKIYISVQLDAHHNWEVQIDVIVFGSEKPEEPDRRRLVSAPWWLHRNSGKGSSQDKGANWVNGLIDQQAASTDLLGQVR